MREDYLSGEEEDLTPEENEFDKALRPVNFEDFAGQARGQRVVDVALGLGVERAVDVAVQVLEDMRRSVVGRGLGGDPAYSERGPARRHCQRQPGLEEHTSPRQAVELAFV